MPNNRLDFESIDQVEVFKENGDVIGTVKVSGVRSIEAAIEKALQQLPEAKDPEAYSRCQTCLTEPSADIV